MMLLISRFFIVVLVAVSIGACSLQHGHEGEYVLEQNSGIEAMDDMLDALSDFMMAGEAPTFVIGKDYLDINGSRTQYDKIFVRESGTQQYLVFLKDNQETLWKIHNNGERLTQNAGLFQLSLRRTTKL